MATLDIVVENLGRVNYVKMGSNILNEQRKGELTWAWVRSGQVRSGQVRSGQSV